MAEKAIAPIGKFSILDLLLTESILCSFSVSLYLVLYTDHYQPNGRNGHTTHIIDDNLYMWVGYQGGLPTVHNNEMIRREHQCLQGYT